MKSPGIKRPLVSVIMPTYNHAQFIGDAIESVINQTWQTWEMLIIDDGSTDNTKSVVQSYVSKDSRIKYFALGQNSGRAAVARNYGINNSKGKYVAFLDSDDMWKPTKIEKQIELLENDDNIFMVYSRYIVIKNGIFLRILPKRKKLRAGNVFVPLFLSNNFIGSSSVLLRNIVKENNYLFDTDIGLRAIEDYALWLEIAKNKQIAYIDEPLVVYREHGSNTSIGIKSYLLRYLQVIKKYRHGVSKRLLIRKYTLIFATICLLIIKKILAKVFVI